ncbi:MAG: tRNA pseudouridine(38-40) synthase TruA [Burkholderiales bacterium]
MRLALGLEYDGSAFCGWQTQPDGCSVQDVVEAALATIAGHRVGAICAGRTDAGVHALAQVMHFDAAAIRPLTAWTRGVNALLPETVSVVWAREVDPQFHARYCATSRRYTYFLLNRSQRPGLFADKVGWLHVPLDADSMRRAAQFLVGEHDFSAFRSAQCQARSPMREMRLITIARRGDLIRMDFIANAFLHHMVRNIVGSLVYVGCGNYPPEWILDLRDSRDRTRSAPTFSAAGLYLSAVEYESRWALPTPPDIAPLEYLFAGAA